VRAGPLDGRADFGLFVDGEVVKDDDITGSHRRHQHLLHVGRKLALSIGPSKTAGAVSASGRKAAMTVCVCQ
jgi:hypothetical protein